MFTHLFGYDYDLYRRGMNNLRLADDYDVDVLLLQETHQESCGLKWALLGKKLFCCG